MGRRPGIPGAGRAGNPRPSGAAHAAGAGRPGTAGPSGPDPLATLLAAPLQDEPAALGPHPDQEAVRPLPLPVVRLKCPLHAESPWPGEARGATPRLFRSKTTSLWKARAFCQMQGFWRACCSLSGGCPCDSLGGFNRRRQSLLSRIKGRRFSTGVEISVQNRPSRRGVTVVGRSRRCNINPINNLRGAGAAFSTPRSGCGP